MKRLKVRNILKRLNDEGWYLHNQRGSQRHFKHAEKGGKVTVAGKESEVIPPKTLARIYEQAGWPKD